MTVYPVKTLLDEGGALDALIERTLTAARDRNRELGAV